MRTTRSCGRGPGLPADFPQDWGVALVKALRQARVDQDTDTWKERYKMRTGVEGTISQGVQRCVLRRSRYRGLAKTSLQHQLTSAAINLARIDAHLTNTPRANIRTSHFAALRPAELMLGGAK